MDSGPSNGIKPVIRPTHEEVFLAQATIVAKLSMDAETKVGCVLARNNRIISTGYNSFPRECDNNILPNTRPNKYDWMVHAEKNAVINSQIDVSGSTAYLNGRPCFRCLTQELWQHNIRNVVYYNGVMIRSLDIEKENALLEEFMRACDHKMNIRVVQFDFDDFYNKYINTHTMRA